MTTTTAIGWTCTAVFPHPKTGWMGVWTKQGSRNVIHKQIVAQGTGAGRGFNGSTQLTREEALEAAKEMKVTW